MSLPVAHLEKVFYTSGVGRSRTDSMRGGEGTCALTCAGAFPATAVPLDDRRSGGELSDGSDSRHRLHIPGKQLPSYGPPFIYVPVQTTGISLGHAHVPVKDIGILKEARKLGKPTLSESGSKELPRKQGASGLV